MKLLIVTQAVDTGDTTLGFFVHWIEKLSARFDHIEVICLRKGQYTVPRNVSVHSLGGEREVTGGKLEAKVRYAGRFLKLIFQLRNEYDAVFVHMNQEYILLAGTFWKLLGKDIFFWRNHRLGNSETSIAVNFSDKVFYTSDDSFTAHFEKSIKMPAGVDLDICKADEHITRKKNSLLVFGRIAPVKRIEKAIEIFTSLVGEIPDLTLDIVGDALPRDSAYAAQLKEQAAKFPGITFSSGVPFREAASVYAARDTLLNFTPSGSFDKTILEGLACGSKVLVTNTSLANILPPGSIIDETNAPQKVKAFLVMNDQEMSDYQQAAQHTVRDQSLDTLIEKLSEEISHPYV